MKFMHRRKNKLNNSQPLEDPITGVANLFDVSVVFIVAMIMALFMAYNMLDFLDPNSEMTLTKKNEKGEMEIITKKGKDIKVQKVTDKSLSGKGLRLGTAYELEDGRVVYVPE